jgi:hypothetical protein
LLLFVRERSKINASKSPPAGDEVTSNHFSFHSLTITIILLQAESICKKEQKKQSSLTPTNQIAGLSPSGCYDRPHVHSQTTTSSATLQATCSRNSPFSLVTISLFESPAVGGDGTAATRTLVLLEKMNHNNESSQRISLHDTFNNLLSASH